MFSFSVLVFSCVFISICLPGTDLNKSIKLIQKVAVPERSLYVGFRLSFGTLSSQEYSRLI